jgi:hypothetical protein
MFNRLHQDIFDTYPNRLTAMTNQLPAITLDQSIDDEFTITATCRSTGAIVAAAMGYWIEDVTLRIDLQLIGMGYEIYAPEDLN